MPLFDVVFVETTTITKRIEAETVAEAYAMAERRWDETGFWDDTDEETEGTDGVESISLDGATMWQKGEPLPTVAPPVRVLMPVPEGCDCPAGSRASGPHHSLTCPEYMPF